MKKHLLIIPCFLLTLSSLCQNAEIFRKWGEETLLLIDNNFKADRGTYLYSEKTSSGYPAYAWPMGVQIKALIHAGRIKAAENLLNDFHNNYYTTRNGIGGYTAGYKESTNANRYYDDNAWIVMDLMELYAANQQDFYLERAKLILNMCMSGESPLGGIMFNEREWDPASGDDYLRWRTCATAPTAYANLQLYEVTKEETYLENAIRLYEFMKQPGNWGIGPGYRGYENAVIMRVALMLHKITGEQKYLDDTYQLAYSMETQYIAWDTRRLNETGQWGGHDMTDAYVQLYEFDKNPRWLNIVAHYLIYIHDNAKNEKGFYTEEWTGIYDPKKDNREELLYQASPASSFMKLAQTPVEAEFDKEPVAVFKEKNYNQEHERNRWSMGLEIGGYTQEDLWFRGMTDSKFNFEAGISSIHIAEGYKVTLYEGNNLNRASVILTESSPDLKEWSKRAKSIKIESLNNVAHFYSQENFTTELISLPLGKYSRVDLERLGLTDISSLKINEGYEIKVFTGDYFYGNFMIYRGNISELGEFNNIISSIIVSPAGTHSKTESHTSDKIVIYPSVVKDILHIENVKVNSLLEVINLSGMALIKDVAVQNYHIMNLSHLPQGIYFFKINYNGNSQVLKFTKG